MQILSNNTKAECKSAKNRMKNDWLQTLRASAAFCTAAIFMDCWPLCFWACACSKETDMSTHVDNWIIRVTSTKPFQTVFLFLVLPHSWFTRWLISCKNKTPDDLTELGADLIFTYLESFDPVSRFPSSWVLFTKLLHQYVVCATFMLFPSPKNSLGATVQTPLFF